MEGKMNMGFALRNVALLGRNLYVGTPEKYSTINTEDIVTYAAKAAGITESCMMQTFIALYDAFEYFLCNGHSFKIDGLGTFSFKMNAMSTDPTATGTVSGANAIKSVGVNFLPDKKVKAMLNGIAWSSVVTGNTALKEFTDFVARRVVLGSDSANIISYDASEAHALKAGDIISLYGYNCPDSMSVVVSGIDASGAEASESFTLKLATAKTMTMMLSSAKATKSIPTVQNININGVDYPFAGTENYVTVKAGTHSIVNGSSFELGSYVFAFSGKDLSSLSVTLDGTALAFSSKSSTSAKTASITLASGSHTLVINGTDTRTFTCTAEPVANVSSLSCNGITVANGGSSSMISGRSYAMVANGQNLNLITLDMIRVPEGSSISGYTLSANNTKLQFNVVFGGTKGTIRLGSYFTVIVTAASQSTVISSVNGIASGGTITTNAEKELAIVADDMSGMTARLTNASSGSVVANGFTLDTENKKIIFNEVGSFRLVIYRADGVTADYTANVTVDVPIFQ